MGKTEENSSCFGCVYNFLLDANPLGYVILLLVPYQTSLLLLLLSCIGVSAESFTCLF